MLSWVFVPYECQCERLHLEHSLQLHRKYITSHLHSHSHSHSHSLTHTHTLTLTLTLTHTHTYIKVAHKNVQIWKYSVISIGWNKHIFVSAQFLLEEKECQPSDSKGVLVVVQALLDLVIWLYHIETICENKCKLIQFLWCHIVIKEEMSSGLLIIVHL